MFERQDDISRLRECFFGDLYGVCAMAISRVGHCREAQIKESESPAFGILGLVETVAHGHKGHLTAADSDT